MRGINNFFLKQPPSLRDAIFFCFFTILITYQPFILYKEIMHWELGIYLPSIQAILDGMVPYRDFFYLRGPFEAYVPAFLMKLWGESIPVLYYFFYAGTVIAYLILILIGRHLYQTRLFYYLMVPVVVARTFPYVYYFNWGGMRYALGLLALASLILYFKRHKIWLIYVSAFSSFAAFFTSVDVGIASIIGLLMGLLIAKALNIFSRKDFLRCAGHYLTGLIVFFCLYGSYLLWTNSLNAYIETTVSVCTNITKIFDTSQNSKYPLTLADWFLSIIPTSKNFKHATPIYLYLIFLGHTFYLYRQKRLTYFYASFICTATYGLLLYCAAWRKIENAQFEMALMPEKLLLFYLYERIFFVLSQKKEKIWGQLKSWRLRRDQLGDCLAMYGMAGLLIVLLLTSWGYAINRFNKRFDAFKVAVNVVLGGHHPVSLEPNPNVLKRRLNLPRMAGMIVPQNDAEEYETLTRVIQALTLPKEPVLFFPEHGMYNFIVGRPFVGRFPMANYAWFNDRWQNEFVQDLKTQKPRIVVIQSLIPQPWKDFALANEANRQKFNEVYGLIEQNYHAIQKTRMFTIYQINQ